MHTPAFTAQTAHKAPSVHLLFTIEASLTSESLTTVSRKPLPAVQGRAILKMDFLSHGSTESWIPVTGQECHLCVVCAGVKVRGALLEASPLMPPAQVVPSSCASSLWVTVAEPHLIPTRGTYLDLQGAPLGQEHLFWRDPKGWSEGPQVVLWVMSGLEVLRQRCLRRASHLLKTDKEGKEGEELLRPEAGTSVSYSLPQS